MVTRRYRNHHGRVTKTSNGYRRYAQSHKRRNTKPINPTWSYFRQIKVAVNQREAAASRADNIVEPTEVESPQNPADERTDTPAEPTTKTTTLVGSRRRRSEVADEQNNRTP